MVFWVAYFVTMLTMLLYQNETLPFANILIKTRYAYILLTIVLIVLNNRIKRQSKLAIFVLSILFIHTFLFGFVFNNTPGALVAANNISVNVKNMFWYLTFVSITYIYVSQNSLFNDLINVSYYACGVQLLIGGIKYRGDFVNPLWGFIQAFTAETRYKTTFGFVHAGYLSNACFYALILSIFYFEINKGIENPRKKRHFWGSFIFIDALALEMLLCAAERAGILATIIAVAIYGIFVFFRFRIETRTKIICALLGMVLILLFIVSGAFTKIWEDSNRGLNISVNYPVFQQLGNIWTGMGYVDNSGFHENIMAFGVKTSSLDLYYVYIFFTTGIIGCVFIGIAMLALLFGLISKKRTNLNITALGMYIAWIFFSFWNCNMLTYRYVSPYILFTILLCGLSNDFCGGEKKTELEYIEQSDNGTIRRVYG